LAQSASGVLNSRKDHDWTPTSRVGVNAGMTDSSA
jgi:hypothetical protein